MDNTRHLVVKLAVIKAVAEAVKDAETATKAALQEAMDPGDRKTAALDGVDVGTVSYAKTAATGRVTDPAAFLAWVSRYHPTEVTAPVTVDARTLSDALDYFTGGDGASRAAYEEVVAALEDARPMVRPAYTEQVLAHAAKDGTAVDRATGEVIPGVEVVPGGQGKYVSARLSDAQRQNLVEAWHAGRLDVLDLATTPPALEAATT